MCVYACASIWVRQEHILLAHIDSPETLGYPKAFVVPTMWVLVIRPCSKQISWWNWAWFFFLSLGTTVRRHLKRMANCMRRFMIPLYLPLAALFFITLSLNPQFCRLPETLGMPRAWQTCQMLQWPRDKDSKKGNHRADPYWAWGEWARLTGRQAERRYKEKLWPSRVGLYQQALFKASLMLPLQVLTLKKTKKQLYRTGLRDQVTVKTVVFSLHCQGKQGGHLEITSF